MAQKETDKAKGKKRVSKGKAVGAGTYKASFQQYHHLFLLPTMQDKYILGLCR